jgi:hypothetical protein
MALASLPIRRGAPRPSDGARRLDRLQDGQERHRGHVAGPARAARRDRPRPERYDLSGDGVRQAVHAGRVRDAVSGVVQRRRLTACTAHGLRKAGATRAAEAGASEKQLNAIFGWGDNSNEARRYTRTAGRKKLAGDAVNLLSVPRTDPGTKIAKISSNISSKK